MANEYRQNWDENGNILDPSMWLEDNNRLAGEVNGGLDRDNFPANTIVSTEMSGGDFVEVQMDSTNTAYSPDRTSTDWQGGSAAGATGLAMEEWVGEEDEHVDVHFNATWSWNGSTSIYEAGSTGNRPTQTDPNEQYYDTVELRLVVDGNVVATLGPFDDGAEYAATYGVASIQLPSGNHKATAECRCARRSIQSGSLRGVCTNTITFTARSLVVLERFR